MTHIFIVDENTFNIHLNYLFAGTGCKDNDLSCITNTKSTPTEKTLTGMIADISKVRVGDKVLFYVTGSKKIYGVFSVESEPFYEPFNPNKTNYLYDKLNKNLTFRIRIKPLTVYSNGINEHEALDDISNIQHPYQMCWSLIYRKLSGNRGCSFLTNFESERIIDLIKKKNNNVPLSGLTFLYNKGTQKIEVSNQIYNYIGNTANTLDVFPRLCEVSNSFEVHLQAFITKMYDKSLKNLFGVKDNTWIGNEVVCSVGEQRIDILIIDEGDSEVNIRIIELKCIKPYKEIIEIQIPWYIQWVDQYISPNYRKTVNIIPTIIAENFTRNTKRKINFNLAKINFNSNIPKVRNSHIKNLEFISFNLDRINKKIHFKLEH